MRSGAALQPVLLGSGLLLGGILRPCFGRYITALSFDLSAKQWSGDLDVLAQHRAIRVLVPYSKTLFFVDYGGTERGMSYDFMHAF